MNTAFVSYSRDDLNIAIDLVRRLEKYPYPTELVLEENRPNDSRYMRPIFLDVFNLSVTASEFSTELQNNLRNSKYLIVICSKSSASSNFVKKEIDYFLETHDNNADFIIAVYVDNIFSGMHPVIDNIVTSRNCPIYVTGKSEADTIGRQYCFYHLLEFLLKVDFHLLYNRYEVYKRRKLRHRMWTAAIILTIIFSALTWAWTSQISKSNAEREQTRTYAAKAQFEQKTFPFSIVVGYVGNFLKPLVETLSETDTNLNVIVYMPYNYDELDFRTRLKMYDNYLKKHYGIDSTSISRRHIRVPRRRRDITIVQIDFDSTSVFVDNATTVSAFKSVIDYKMSVKDIDWGQDCDQMVRFYSNEFIKCAHDSLGSVSPYVHFIRDTNELDSIITNLLSKVN